MQHHDDLEVDSAFEQNGQVLGTTYVRSSGVLTCFGQLVGGLVIDDGGRAIVHGQVPGNVINNGELELYGQIIGRLIGNLPKNSISSEQIIGSDSSSPPVPSTELTD